MNSNRNSMTAASALESRTLSLGERMMQNGSAANLRYVVRENTNRDDVSLSMNRNRPIISKRSRKPKVIDNYSLQGSLFD